MRIAQVIALYLPEFEGGATLVCQRLSEGLTRLGHEVAVFSGRTTASEPLGAVARDVVGPCATWRVNVGGALAPWTTESYWNPVASASFAELLSTTRPNVIHAHSLQGLGAGVLDAAAEAGVPVVLTMHDWWWLCPCLFRLSTGGSICPALVQPETCAGHPEIDFVARRKSLDAALTSVARILVPSAFLRDSLIENGFTAARIAIQENGVVPPRPCTRAELPGCAERLRFVYVGGAGNSAKGLEVLLEASALLGDRRFALDCYAVGPEEAAPWVHRLGERLRLLPRFSADRLDEVLASADVVVLPSVMRESYSLVVRESLARGVPVITTDSGGPEEVVRDGENGLVVPSASDRRLADAMQRVIDDRPLVARLAAAPRPSLSSPEDHARACEGLYREVLRESATRSFGAPAPAARMRLTGRCVLFLTGIDGAPLRYRVWQLTERLALGGIRSRVLYHSDVAALEAAREADLVVLFRAPFSAMVASVVAAARERRIPVVFSVDDLVFRPDALGEAPALEHPRPEVVAGYRESVSAYARTCAAADYFLGSTPELADAAADLGMPTWVVPNGLGESLLVYSESARIRQQSVRREKGTLRIGFLSGTDTHDVDLALIAAPLARLLMRHPDFRLVIGGPVRLPVELALLERQIERWPLLPWSDLPERLAELDVSLAPLDLARPFNRAKSEIKVLEAAAVGVPSVASPSPAFRRATRDGLTSVLCDSAEAWESEIERLLRSSAERQALGSAARRSVLERYAPESQVDDLIDVLGEILDRGAPGERSLPLPIDMEAGEGSCVALEPLGARYDAYQLDAERGGPLGPGREVEQSFTCRYDGVWRVDVLVGTYARRNDHEVFLTVHDEDGRVLGEQRCQAARLVDRQFVSLELDAPLQSSAGRRLRLRAAAPAARTGNEILLWHAPSTQGGLSIGGAEAPGRTLTFRSFAEAHA